MIITAKVIRFLYDVLYLNIKLGFILLFLMEHNYINRMLSVEVLVTITNGEESKLI